MTLNFELETRTKFKGWYQIDIRTKTKLDY